MIFLIVTLHARIKDRNTPSGAQSSSTSSVLWFRYVVLWLRCCRLYVPNLSGFAAEAKYPRAIVRVKGTVNFSLEIFNNQCVCVDREDCVQQCFMIYDRTRKETPNLNMNGQHRTTGRCGRGIDQKSSWILSHRLNQKTVWSLGCQLSQKTS